MKVSKVIVCRADRMPSSIDGKISSPFKSTSKRLPPTTGGPSSSPIERVNCGSSLAYSRSILCSIFFSPLVRFAIISTTTSVTATVKTIRAIVGMRGPRVANIRRNR
ncbi:hypothetical protein LMG27174_07283 [Paraburkholderia rhynchosiae]|uniref:Uncharacterized protein n=1 Tax=Paraburkholderia rhynchosiae TaxID=487049 RepID=A0A6J5CUM8_9BURK|nr:hypothetical protein LMG27174_07283 [Paraburkholderia rhynchosiae]